MEDNGSDDEFNISRRNTINKLENLLKNEAEKFHQKQDMKNQENEIKKSMTKEDLRKSITLGSLGYNNKEILDQKLSNLIKNFEEKHKQINYERMPDYISKKEDNCQLIKSCIDQINDESSDLPLTLIIIENEFFDEFSLFLEKYIKYKDYKVVYVLKNKLLIKKNLINNYEIFHKKNNEENDNCFFAETISTSMTDLYDEKQIKEIKKNINIISNDFKEHFEEELKKWVGLIFNIISDYILFHLKEKPLYYCCDVCGKPIIYKEKNYYRLIDNNKIKNKTENGSNNNNLINDNNNINVNENNSIEKKIKQKKKNDIKIINKIINDENKKNEFKSLFNVANNIIDLIDFSKNLNASSNHNIANPPKKKHSDNGSINNIIYYTENKYADFELFEREVSGAFIIITDQNSLQFALKCIKKNNELKKFILLIQGQCCEKIIKYLEENNYLNDFGSCIIFTKNDKFNYLKNNYNIIKGIFKSKKEIINYISNYINEEGLYHTFKVINLKKYFDYYFEFHKIISSFYGQLSQDLYDTQINILKAFLKNDSNPELLEALKEFEGATDNKEGIIKGYTGNSYYKQFNKWLYSLDSLALQQTGYFLSGLSYSLNLFGEEKNTGVNQEITLYRGASMSYINILPYKINVGNIITFPNFLSTSTSLNTAKNFSSYYLDEYNDFRVIYTIKYLFKPNWIPNAFNVVGVSLNSYEEERLFQAYSFFLVKNVSIDINNHTADIELETIGKTSVLEESIQKDKKIWYNYKENAMEILNDKN